MEGKRKNKIIAIVLAITTGFINGQLLYTRNKGDKNVQWFMVSILFCWTFLPLISSIIQIVSLLFMSTNKFDLKYNNNYVFYKGLKHTLV